MPIKSRLLVSAFLLLLQQNIYAQEKKIREYNKTFQVALFPGISTNGIHSGMYYNNFSLNVFGGLSAGNKILELGLISNVDTKSNTGIKIAGLANVVGANAFLNLSTYEERNLINKEDFESNAKGIQVAGFLNYVRDHSQGIQLAGFLNVVGGDLKGFQLAGIGNSAGNGTNGFSEGVQLAGFYNISKESIAGFQAGSLFNYTDGELSGTQIALINKARVMKGRHTMPPTKAKSLQIGLVNFSKEMDGTQVGLINFGGKSLGKQFGLINFYQTYPTKEKTRYNTSVGLINFGTRGSTWRLSFNETFPLNLEYTRGNCLNCSTTQSQMPFDDANQIFNQNAWIVGFDPSQNTWGFGYGFEKILYNKNSMLPSDPSNRKRIITYGVNFLHLNRDRSFDRSFNLLNKLHFEYGKRKWGRYVYVGVSLNYFVYEKGMDASVYKINSARVSTGEVFNLNSEFWPGYSVGIQL